MPSMSTLPVRIMLADSADLLLVGARLVLDQHPDCRVLAVVQDFQALLGAAQHQPTDVIVLGEGLDPDLDMWGQVEQLQAAVPCTRYILMSARTGGPLIHDAFAHGIDGVLCKSDDLQTHLHGAVLAVMRGRPYLSPTANTEYLVAIRASGASDTLDQEARAILQLLVQGHHTGQIACRLKVPVRRVYWVREKLRQRFGALTNEHMISRATAEGFVYPS